MSDQSEATCVSGIGDDGGGPDDLVTGGLQGDGEAAAVRIGAGERFGGVDHHSAQDLVEG
ncbi:hypothetical protein [Streptomyces sp. NPDC060027]|uniref:hypothetical protein n=1 Tax=Streptomyces sp. NPDC060027 TaxID=3347040 RepID=UPI003693F69D